MRKYKIQLFSGGEINVQGDSHCNLSGFLHIDNNVTNDKGRKLIPVAMIAESNISSVLIEEEKLEAIECQCCKGSGILHKVKV